MTNFQTKRSETTDAEDARSSRPGKPRSALPFHSVILVWAALATVVAGCGGGVPFPGLDADEIFNLGVQAYESGDWTAAIKAFERVLITPGFTRAPEARLYMAKSYFGDEKFILSRSEYQRVLDRYPADTVAPHASLGVCEAYAKASPILQRDQTPTRNAWQSCGNVARDYAGTLVGLHAAEIQLTMYNKLAEADYVRGKHYFRRRLYDSALIFFEDVLKNYPDSEWAPWAMHDIIQAFEKIGYEADAEEYRRRLKQTYPDSEAAKSLSGTAEDAGG
jgi:outer membrane protein assembly factor BamD